MDKAKGQVPFGWQPDVEVKKEQKVSDPTAAETSGSASAAAEPSENEG